MPAPLIDASLVLAGLVMLAFGGESLVRGATGLALRLGVAPLLIGLTVVSFGTTTPEMGVSLQAAFRGVGDIALGNVVGSNICNMLLILGLCATIRPVQIHLQILRTDVPIMVGVSALVVVLLLDGVVGRGDGALLFAGILGYVGLTIWMAKRSSAAENRSRELLVEEVSPPRPGRLPVLLVWIALGLGLLFMGSRLLVDGAVSLASQLKVPEAVVGLTLVAVGTSLPELATAVVGAVRGKTDLVVGNLIGANLFNLLANLGLSSSIHPIVQGGVTRIDLAVMLVSAVAVIPMMRTGWVLKRWEGGLLLLGYAGYLTWLAWPG